MGLLRIVPRAQDDLVEIWCRIAADKPEAADRFIDAIRKRCEQASNTPESGRSREELAPDVRSLPFRRNVIFYRALADPRGIEILRILSAARDIRVGLFEEDA